MKCMGDEERWRKHRFRQKASNTLAALLCLLHLLLGGLLVWEKCTLAPLLIVFSLFGVCLITDRKVSSNLRIIWGYQLILVVLVSPPSLSSCSDISHLPQ
jgi:hypothetical protein